MPCVEDNAPARTEDPDNQTNDITNGGVSTGRDVRTVRFVFVSICCGVARLTNLGYLNSGKSALMYLASFARKGTITLVVCPTNSLESDLVRIVLLAIYNFRDDVMIGLEHEPERNICTGNQCRDF